MTELPDAAHLRSRQIGIVTAEASDAEILIEHVYMAEGMFTCSGCGSGHDAGSIGMVIDGGEENHASILLSAEEALVLANRLSRAASVVFEAGEQPEDMERSAARLTEASEEGNGG